MATGKHHSWLWRWRYLLSRRLTQAAILLFFWGTAKWGWQVAGAPLLRGNLSASELLGSIPLADPLAALQLLLAGGHLETRVLLGAGLVLLFYGLLGGRSFCSWVCPLNPVTDLASWLRGKLGLRRGWHLGRGVRYWILGLALGLSAVAGVAAFEWISPIGMVHRGILFGLGLAWVVVIAIFLFDLLAVRHGWCGHLCPLGAFYGLLGRAAQLRVAFDAETCTHCGDCLAVCPEPWVLDLEQAARNGLIASGDCTNCGRCMPICPEGSLGFDLRFRITARRTT